MNLDEDRPRSIRPVPRNPDLTLSWKKGSCSVGKIVKMPSFMFESMNLESSILKLGNFQGNRLVGNTAWKSQLTWKQQNTTGNID